MTVIDLANRKTVSKRTPEIDSLYVYSTRHKAKFTHRHQQGVGYKYTNHKAILKAGENEIHIYHRTALIDGVTNGLTMVTKDGGFRKVQKFFKDSIEQIENDPQLLAKFKAAKPSPAELGIYYFN